MSYRRYKWKTIKDAVRNKYAWPGGYPLYLITGDGDALSIDAARHNWRLVCSARIRGDKTDSWYIVDADINYEDQNLYCAHSGERIEFAYGEEE